MVRMGSESEFDFKSIIGDTLVKKVGSNSNSCLIRGLSILQMCFYKDEICGYR